MTRQVCYLVPGRKIAYDPINGPWIPYTPEQVAARRAQQQDRLVCETVPCPSVLPPGELVPAAIAPWPDSPIVPVPAPGSAVLLLSALLLLVVLRAR